MFLVDMYHTIPCRTIPWHTIPYSIPTKLGRWIGYVFFVQRKIRVRFVEHDMDMESREDAI